MQALGAWQTNEELAASLQDFAARCGAVARLYSIGRSVRGNPLWALEISDRPGQVEPEPNAKFVGNIHGDEPSGR